MKIQNIPISDIKPYEKNPRNNDSAVDAVANSIKEFGFQQPLVLDKNNVIVCGHTRYKASQGKQRLQYIKCLHRLKKQLAECYVYIHVDDNIDHIEIR